MSLHIERETLGELLKRAIVIVEDANLANRALAKHDCPGASLASQVAIAASKLTERDELVCEVRELREQLAAAEQTISHLQASLAEACGKDPNP